MRVRKHAARLAEEIARLDSSLLTADEQATRQAVLQEILEAALKAEVTEYLGEMANLVCFDRDRYMAMRTAKALDVKIA